MADRETVKRLDKAALDVKFHLLELCNKEAMHIGGDMSCCEILTVIWQYAMKYDIKNPRWEGRDRYVLSKGHAAAVTSFSQAAIGCYETAEIFSEYATDLGRFGMHSCNLRNPYVDVSTGSLGHGMPVAGGIAAALKMKKSDSRVYVVVGDGECGEGSIWESAMSAHQFKLGNLVVFVDRNKLSFDGPTESYMALEPFADKWQSFGWNVMEVNGNDVAELINAVDSIPSAGSEIPTVIIGNTIKGHGLSFMENNVGWHAGMVSDDLLKTAKKELQKAFDEKWGEE